MTKTISFFLAYSRKTALKDVQVGGYLRYDLAEDLGVLDVACDGLKKFTRLTTEHASCIANNLDSILHHGKRVALFLRGQSRRP